MCFCTGHLVLLPFNSALSTLFAIFSLWTFLQFILIIIMLYLCSSITEEIYKIKCTSTFIVFVRYILFMLRINVRPKKYPVFLATRPYLSEAAEPSLFTKMPFFFRWGLYNWGFNSLKKRSRPYLKFLRPLPETQDYYFCLMHHTCMDNAACILKTILVDASCHRIYYQFANLKMLCDWHNHLTTWRRYFTSPYQYQYPRIRIRINMEHVENVGAIYSCHLCQYPHL